MVLNWIWRFVMIALLAVPFLWAEDWVVRAQQFPLTAPLHVIVESGTVVTLGEAGSSTVLQGGGAWAVTFSGTSAVLAYPTGVYFTTVIGPLTTSVASGTSNVLAYPTGVYFTTVIGPLTTSVASGTSSVLAYPTGVYATTVIGPLTTSVASGTSNVLAYPTGVTSTTQIGPFSVISGGVQSTTQAGPFSVVSSGTQAVLAYPTGVYAVTFSGTSNVLAYPTGVQSTTQSGPFSVVSSGVTSTTSVGPVSVTVPTSYGKTLTYINVNQTVAGSTQLAASSANNRHKIIGAVLTISLAGTLTFIDPGGNLIGPFDLAANGGMALPPSLIPYQQTGSNTTLSLVTTLGAARGVVIVLTEP